MFACVQVKVIGPRQSVLLRIMTQVELRARASRDPHYLGSPSILSFFLLVKEAGYDGKWSNFLSYHEQTFILLFLFEFISRFVHPSLRAWYKTRRIIWSNVPFLFLHQPQLVNFTASLKQRRGTRRPSDVIKSVHVFRGIVYEAKGKNHQSASSGSISINAVSTRINNRSEGVPGTQRWAAKTHEGIKSDE